MVNGWLMVREWLTHGSTTVEYWSNVAWRSWSLWQPLEDSHGWLGLGRFDSLKWLWLGTSPTWLAIITIQLFGALWRAGNHGKASVTLGVHPSWTNPHEKSSVPSSTHCHCFIGADPTFGSRFANKAGLKAPPLWDDHGGVTGDFLSAHFWYHFDMMHIIFRRQLVSCPWQWTPFINLSQLWLNTFTVQSLSSINHHQKCLNSNDYWIRNHSLKSIGWIKFLNLNHPSSLIPHPPLPSDSPTRILLQLILLILNTSWLNIEPPLCWLWIPYPLP